MCVRAGQLLAATADARQLHLPVLLSAFAAVVLCRSAMALASAFTVHALLVLISEAGNAPVVVLADASVAAAAPNVSVLLLGRSASAHLPCPVLLGRSGLRVWSDCVAWHDCKRCGG